MKDEFLGLKNNNKGQFAIEAVLLMTVLVGAFLVVTSEVKKRGLLSKFVEKPVTRLGTMSGYGTWQSECVGQGSSKKQTLGKCHPNSIHRSLSSDPK